MKKRKLELTLFDGDGANAAAPSAESTAADAQPQANEPVEAQPDKNARFEELIKGEFKEEFDRRIQNNLKRRFKESSELKERNSQNEQIINALKAKYGISESDPSRLMEAINNDDFFIREEARKRGMNADTLKKLKALEFENRSMKERIRRERSEAAMNETLRAWMESGKSLSEKHPDFDLEREASNPRFIQLLKGGADPETAYYAIHHSEILKNAIEKAVNDTREKTAQSIKARGNRPPENGTNQKSTALFKTDVSRLTPAQRAEIAERVSRGEVISF